MAEYVQWDQLPKSSSSGESDSSGKVPYLRMKTGNEYRIRPIYFPLKFYKYFHNDAAGKLRTAICADPDTCPVKGRHPDLKPAGLRYAAYVIDRADDKIKILEAPPSVFRPLGSHMEATGRNPGGTKDGSDWRIKVTGQGKKTRYDVTFIDLKPLTDEEKQMIRDQVGSDVKTALVELFKVDPVDVIEKRLFGNDDSESSNDDTPEEAAVGAGDGGGEAADMNW